MLNRVHASTTKTTSIFTVLNSLKMAPGNDEALAMTGVSQRTSYRIPADAGFVRVGRKSGKNHFIYPNGKPFYPGGTSW